MQLLISCSCCFFSFPFFHIFLIYIMQCPWLTDKEPWVEWLRLTPFNPHVLSSSLAPPFLLFVIFDFLSISSCCSIIYHSWNLLDRLKIMVEWLRFMPPNPMTWVQPLLATISPFLYISSFFFSTFFLIFWYFLSNKFSISL